MAEDARSRWDDRYSTEGFVWGVEPSGFVAELAAGLPPGRALDLGCGQGRNAIWLASKGHQVTGLDISPVAIDQAQRLAARRGVEVEFEAVDLTTWEPGNESWDLVLLSYIQVLPASRWHIHRAAAEAVAPGGHLLLVAHHRDNLEHGVGGPPNPDLLFDEEMLLADFSELDVDRCERVYRDVDGANAIDVVLIATRPA